MISKVFEYVGKFLLVPLIKDLWSFLMDKIKEYIETKKEKKEAQERAEIAEKKLKELQNAKTDKDKIDSFNKLP